MAVPQASLLQSFPFRAAVFAACVLLIPLVPSPQPPAAAGGDGGGHRGEAFVAKVWELLHLLVVGIAVSYGLFSRRNDAGGRRADDKDVAAAAAAKADNARYVSQMIHDSLVFDDGGGDVVLDTPRGEVVQSSWSAMRRPDEPVVVVATAAGDAPTLSLPVRTLKPQSESGYGDGGEARRRRSSHDTPATGVGGNETVLRSPIPWRSRSGRLDASSSSAAARSSPSPSPSPKRLSPASSLSKETIAKASEDYSRRRISPYKQSSPPAPPPPPPPFLVHGYHPPAAAERRTPAARSFKEELHDHLQTSHSFSSNSSSAKPRTSIDGSSSSSSSYYAVGKSVRTIRGGGGRETSQFQSQEQSDVTVAGAGEAPVHLHGSDSDDPYGGYRAYQSIPRFQYERGSSDPILGNVTVSSESSDDDDDAGGEVSTRGSSPRRESSPEVDENEVDKKAEEFIARFREQIRLQRIESIKKSAGPRGVKHGK